MIHEVCSVDAGTSLSVHIHIQENRPQNLHGRGEGTYDHCRNTPDHYGQTFEPP